MAGAMRPKLGYMYSPLAHIVFENNINMNIIFIAHNCTVIGYELGVT